MSIIKTLVLILLTTTVVINSYSQGTLLYNEFGQLRCDSSYQIDTELLDVIGDIEYVLYQVYEKVQYPSLAYENGIGGIVIAKLHVDNEGLSVWGEIVKRLDPSIDKAVSKAIHTSYLVILRKTVGMDNFVFYLPFKFEVTTIPFIEDLEEHGLIRVRKQALSPRRIPM